MTTLIQTTITLFLTVVLLLEEGALTTKRADVKPQTAQTTLVI